MKLENEIRNILAQWLQAFNANDVDALMELYDPEINYMGNNASTKVGIPAIRARFVASFSGSKLSVTFQEQQVIAEERLGYITGHFSVTGSKDGATVRSTGRVVCIFRKKEAGEWKLIFDMDNEVEKLLG